MPPSTSLLSMVTITRFFSALVVWTVLGSLHQANRSLSNVYAPSIVARDSSLNSISESSNIRSGDKAPSIVAGDSSLDSILESSNIRGGDKAPSIVAGDLSLEIASESSNHQIVSITYSEDDHRYVDDNNDHKRAIVIVSMGAKASDTSLVERFVWSARNMGNYSGWIVLITDAEKERYSNLAAAAYSSSSSIEKSTTGSDLDSNDKNRFLVLRPEEERFANITNHKSFKALTMNSKVYKTYTLEYAKKDPRLDEIELFYYLDVDIVFGNSVRPLFTELEKQYGIGNLHGKDEKESRDEEDDVGRAPQSKTAKIYFFEGNGKKRAKGNIQGGQYIMERETSQPCLKRWWELMQKNRKEKFLNDQLSLNAMLKEQQIRADANNATEKDCEIIIMKQDKKLIMFPELDDIDKRTGDILFQEKFEKAAMPERFEYPTLLHFRNTAGVMEKVTEDRLELYLRDILRFDLDQSDDLGFLNKNLMDKIKK